MRAVQWFGPRDIRVTADLPLPSILGPRDAIVRVTLSAICGTDLHPYRGEIPNFLSGTVMGHEFTGVIEDTGPGVAGLMPGDRVLASDVIACGSCWYCRQGWHYQCASVSLFGYGTVVGDYIPGGQAEYVRVPFADVVLSKIPDTFTDEQILFVGDILSTGFMCAEAAQIPHGATVAVLGCGPVGLLSIQSALVLGAHEVLAIDPEPSRQAAAQRLGAQTLSFGPNLTEQVQVLTAGRGADAVLDAVGTAESLGAAVAIARPRSIISVVGVPQSGLTPFPAQAAFGKELAIRYVVGDPINARDRILPLIASGQLDPAQIISHRLPLAEAAAAYDLFDQRKALKIVLLPQT